jgi:hypothetical protein
MKSEAPSIYAIIGVSYKEGKTFYVKRSSKMKNYPDVWSLISIQISKEEFQSHLDLASVSERFDELSRERLSGAKIRVLEHLTSDDSDKNNIGCHVFLHLYHVDVLELNSLNPDYYVASDWLNQNELDDLNEDLTCGLCTRMWKDYAWHNDLLPRDFLPDTLVESV